MQETYTEILFTLYMHGGQGTMPWLTEFLSSSPAPDSTILQHTNEGVGLLAAAGFLKLTWEGDCACVALTEQGNQAALVAAELISEQMLEQWQQTYVA